MSHMLVTLDIVEIIFFVMVILALAGLAIYLCRVTPYGKYIAIALILIVYLSFTSYSTMYVFSYFNIKGGIFGRIDEIPKLSENEIVIDVDSLKFNFNNISMKEISDGYSATLTYGTIIDLDNAKYTILVNGTPVGICENSTDYIMGQYTYTFYNSDKVELLTDTLTISIAFNDLGTECILRTAGDGNVVKYWNYYFAKNGFIVTLERDGYESPKSWNIISEGKLASITEDLSSLKIQATQLKSEFNAKKQEISDYIAQDNVDSNQLDIYISDMQSYSTTATSYLSSTSAISLRLHEFKEEYSDIITEDENLNNQVIDLEQQISSISNDVTNVKNLSAEYIEALENRKSDTAIVITYLVDGATYTTQTITSNTISENVANPTKSGYRFIGWSLDGETIVYPLTMNFTNNTIFIAVFVDENEITDITADIYSATSVNVTYKETSNIYSPSGSVITASHVADVACKSTDTLQIQYANIGYILNIETDGQYTTTKLEGDNTTMNLYEISWTNATYILIKISKTSSSGSTTV